MASLMTMVDRLSATGDAEPSADAQFRAEGGIDPGALRPRTLVVAIWRGVRGRCPACGCTRLFRTFLKPVPSCFACGEDWLAQSSDDFPPYVVILLLGHVIAPGMIALETLAHPPLWAQLAIWMPLTVILAISLIQPAKGGVIALQWWHGARLRGDPAQADGTAAPAGSAKQD